MFSAVHSDRSGRLVIAADYAAAMSDGSSIGPLGRAVRLPAGTDVVPLPGRTGIGVDRSGRARDLGAGRFGVAAIVPIGYLRIGLPAYEEDPVAPPLKTRGYAAVGADADGELVVAAIALDTEAGGVDGRAALGLGGRITAMQREHPSNRLLRQLARCAKDYRCRAAANAFLGRHDCALPVGAPNNERPAEVLVLRDDADASPTEPAAFKPTPEEIADAASRHLDGGGMAVVFGRACEGEPLLAVRVVEAAIGAIRERTRLGTVHLETNGAASRGSPPARGRAQPVQPPHRSPAGLCGAGFSRRRGGGGRGGQGRVEQCLAERGGAGPAGGGGGGRRRERWVDVMGAQVIHPL